MFVLGVAIFALASAACGFTPNIDQLILARSIRPVQAAFRIVSDLHLGKAAVTQFRTQALCRRIRARAFSLRAKLRIDQNALALGSSSEYSYRAEWNPHRHDE